MKVEVLLFALARDRAGRDTVSVELAEAACVGDLRTALAAAHPELADILSRSMIALDSDFAADTQPLSGAREIACIPPVSGG